jgi:uncharacterized protein YcbX
MPTVAALYRYPVKGLSPEPIASADVTPGSTIPFDRAYAVENGPSGFDPAAPQPLPKIAFLMLMRNERLAALSTRYDDVTGTLSIHAGGRRVAEGRLDTPEGAAAIERFLSGYMGPELRGAPRVLGASGHSFSDAGENFVSLINLESVRDLEAHVGVPVSPLRFRGNLLVEGLPAWSEFDWVGRRVTVGPVVLEAMSPIERCAATNVNPETAARDLAIPRTLLEVYGHACCGVYLKVLSAGRLSVGDNVVAT